MSTTRNWHAAVSGVPDERGLPRRIKNVVPERLFVPAVATYNRVLSRVPVSVKYGVGEYLRRSKFPYCLIRPGDNVLQVGAPSDLLRAGRSRTVYFARLASEGRVIAMEPDARSVEALEQHARSCGLSNLTVVPRGGWSEATTLQFLSSPTHPASSVLEGVKDMNDEQVDYRDYQRVEVPVDTVDHVLSELGSPHVRVVSITTNGAELRILDGMRETLSRCRPFLSLAKTGDNYLSALEELGYSCIANDDRGFTFAPVPEAAH